MNIAVIIGIALVVLCIVVLCYVNFSTETEAQLFIDSYLETERILKQKELQYQEFMKNNPPKIYPKVIDEQDTGAIPRDYS